MITSILILFFLVASVSCQPQWIKNSKIDEEKFMQNVPSQCRPKYLTEDLKQRFCPVGASGKPSVCNDCDTKCAVRGDPHLAPLYSSCTEVVGSNTGRYIFFEIPSVVSIEMDIFKVSQPDADKGYENRHWIQFVYINGAIVQDANYCDLVNKNATEYTFKTKSMWGRSQDITIDVEVGCTVERNHNARHIYIQLNVNDPYGRYELPNPDSMPPKGILPYFNGGRGACFDPVRYGRLPYKATTKVSYGTPDDTYYDAVKATPDDYRLVCTRLDPWKNKGSLRNCKCKTGCSAFGDPSINSFYQKAAGRPGSPNNFLTTFSDDVATNYLYSLLDLFAVSYELDPTCHSIKRVNIDVMTNGAKKRVFGCFPDAGSSKVVSAVLESTNSSYVWNSTTVDATSFCTKQGDEMTLTSPNLGQFAMLQGEAGPKLVPLINSDTSPTKCLGRAGHDAATASNLIDMGNVEVTVKCSMNEMGHFNFNVCVKRVGVEVRPFIELVNGRMTQWPLVSANFSSVSVLQQIEKSAMSSGWCALGRPKNKKRFDSADFEYRNWDEHRLFFKATG